MATIKYKISGHEKFAFRDGWLEKGLDLLINKDADKEEDKYLDASIFNSVNAADRLGVGSNMVKSIRYWMSACNLIEKKGNKTIPSETAKIIYACDRYFEDPFTWWIIHSNIARNKQESVVWYLFFNKITADTFSKEDIIAEIQKELNALLGNDYSEKSLRDSIDVLLKMYVKNIERKDDPEDKNICPLAFLNLIGKEEKGYINHQPDISTVSSDLLLYELAKMFENEKSISIERIYSGDCGMKNIYHISRMTLNQLLDELESKEYISINRTAGLDVVYSNNLPSIAEIIRNHYQ